MPTDRARCLLVSFVRRGGSAAGNVALASPARAATTKSSAPPLSSNRRPRPLGDCPRYVAGGRADVTGGTRFPRIDRRQVFRRPHPRSPNRRAFRESNLDDLGRIAVTDDQITIKREPAPGNQSFRARRASRPQRVVGSLFFSSPTWRTIRQAPTSSSRRAAGEGALRETVKRPVVRRRPQEERPPVRAASL